MSLSPRYDGPTDIMPVDEQSSGNPPPYNLSVDESTKCTYNNASAPTIQEMIEGQKSEPSSISVYASPCLCYLPIPFLDKSEKSQCYTNNCIGLMEPDCSCMDIGIGCSIAWLTCGLSVPFSYGFNECISPFSKNGFDCGTQIAYGCLAWPFILQKALCTDFRNDKHFITNANPTCC